jgi:hypothetical protein
MKKLLILTSIIFVTFALTSCEKKENEKKPSEAQIAELRASAGKFLGHLKSVLVNEMQNNGVIVAVKVCSDTALVLTEQIGKAKNVQIKRVSERNRNPNNSPDEFELSVLEKFRKLHSSKQIDGATEYAGFSEIDGMNVIRYMKPIIVQNECLSCHGSSEYIPDAVSSLLTELYPEDKARDYSIGDLRGAVSIIKIINK